MRSHPLLEQPTLFDQRVEQPERPERQRRARSRRRALVHAEPLSGRGMAASAFVSACLAEHRKAIKSEASARHNLEDAVKAGASLDEQGTLEATMHRHALRVAQVHADLVTWGTRP